MSSIVIPARSRHFSAAGPGAVSMISGSSAATADITSRARGLSPCACAYSGDASRTAPAPSTTPELLPAWWTWFNFTPGYFWSISWAIVSSVCSNEKSTIFGKLGASEASPSAVVDGRGYSSWSSATVPSSLTIDDEAAVEATLLQRDGGAALTLQSRARRTARGSSRRPWRSGRPTGPAGTCGWVASRCSLLAWKPSVPLRAGRLIASTPAPITNCWWPAPTPIAANVTACWPEPQKRFSVTPGTVTGQPASSTAMRPMSWAWSPACEPLPHTTSSTSTGRSPPDRAGRSAPGRAPSADGCERGCPCPACRRREVNGRCR